MNVYVRSGAWDLLFWLGVWELKMIFLRSRHFMCQEIFHPWVLISKMDVKMKFRMITKNYVADAGTSFHVLVRPFWKSKSESDKDCWFTLIKYILVYKNQASKMNFIGLKKFFSWLLISKMDIKISLRIIMRNRAAKLEVEIPTKSILKPYGRQRESLWNVCFY